MYKGPSITIVIPVRNRAALVERTLESVAAQTLRPLALVLVDNGSTDGSDEVLLRWRDKLNDNGIATRVVSEPRPGASVARNRGLQEVNSDYVMFFDSDDTMAPDHCQRVAYGIVDAGLPDIAGWQVSEHRLDGVTAVGRFSRRKIMVNHIFHGCVSTQRFAARTKLVRAVGGWDEDLRSWVDYELGIRLLLAAHSVARLPIRVDSVQIYSQVESITGTGYTGDPDKWVKALDRCSEVLSKAKRRDLMRLIDVRRVILAGAYHREGRSDLADALISSLLDATPSLWCRSVYRLLYWWALTIRRGVSIPARLLL